MIRNRVVLGLCSLAASLGDVVLGSEWYLFGSVDRDEENARDIDLLIVCRSHLQADSLRGRIDVDSFELPLHLAFMTVEEEAGVSAVQMQQARAIFP